MSPGEATSSASSASAPASAGPSNERTLYVIHIPGTVGMWLPSALGAIDDLGDHALVYEQADLAGAVSIDGYAAWPRADRERRALIVGSYPYGLHELSRRAFRYLTFLRDPVERVVELHRESLTLASLRQRAREDALRPDSSRAALTLEDFVFGQQRLAVDNGMVRYIAGRQRVRFGQCPDDLLDEALANVERDFDALLVAEELETSMRVLERSVGHTVQAPPVGGQATRTELQHVSPGLVDRIRKLNLLDLSLYEVARSRLPELSDRLAG